MKINDIDDIKLLHKFYRDPDSFDICEMLYSDPEGLSVHNIALISISHDLQRIATSLEQLVDLHP